MDSLQHHSLVLVTSLDALNNYYADVLNFFQTLNISKKDFIIYSPEPITDYSDIKKIPANEMIIIYQKDFFPLNIGLKPSATQVLAKKSYDIVVHFNNEKYLRNTYLIASKINGKIKISNQLAHSKKFPVVFYHSSNFLSNVADFLGKTQY